MALIDDLRAIRDSAQAAIAQHRYADMRMSHEEAITDVLKRKDDWCSLYHIQSSLRAGGRIVRSQTLRNRLKRMHNVRTISTTSPHLHRIRE